MAKLTAEQKDSNKAARKDRDQRFAARRKLHAAARTQLELDTQALPEREAAARADHAMTLLTEERNARLQSIQEQIARLESQLADVRAEYEPRVAAAKASRSEAYDCFRKASNKLSEAVESQFPDLAGAWGPAQWRPELIAESR